MAQLKRIKPPARSQKVRTTIRVPQRMLDSLHLHMETRGFSVKRRSSFIAQSIRSLLDAPDHIDLIQEEFIEPGGNVPIPLTIDAEIKREVEKIDATLNKDVELSSVARTAITQTLLRG